MWLNYSNKLECTGCVCAWGHCHVMQLDATPLTLPWASFIIQHLLHTESSQTDRQTGRQTDRQTGRQDRQTDRQTDWQTDRQIVVLGSERLSSQTCEASLGTIDVPVFHDVNDYSLKKNNNNKMNCSKSRGVIGWKSVSSSLCIPWDHKHSLILWYQIIDWTSDFRHWPRLTFIQG
jgi:hypothetical protein